MSELLSAIPPSLDAWAAEHPLSSFTDSSGHRWEVRDSAPRERTLVLLPGAAGSGDVAWRIAAALEGELRTITVTYPGGVSAASLSQGLAELLDRRRLDAVAVWGSSYGAWWSQDFAARHPQRVSALWLGNCFVDGRDVAHIPLFDLAWLRAASPAEVKQTWLEATQRRPPSELKDFLLYFIEQSISDEGLRARLIEVASSEPLPATARVADLVVGDCADDPIIGEATRERVAQRYPQARHVRLRAGGHYPHLVNVDALLVELRRWLRL